MSGLPIALILYLFPGVLIVALNTRATIARHGAHGTYILFVGMLLAILTWPMAFYLPWLKR